MSASRRLLGDGAFIGAPWIEGPDPPVAVFLAVESEQVVPGAADTLVPAAPACLASLPLQPEQVFSAPRALGRIDVREAHEGVYEECVLVQLCAPVVLEVVRLIGSRVGCWSASRPVKSR
jgi:hypothetical protein